jgi:hypothetical protein
LRWLLPYCHIAPYFGVAIAGLLPYPVMIQLLLPYCQEPLRQALFRHRCRYCRYIARQRSTSIAIVATVAVIAVRWLSSVIAIATYCQLPLPPLSLHCHRCHIATAATPHPAILLLFAGISCMPLLLRRRCYCRYLSHRCCYCHRAVTVVKIRHRCWLLPLFAVDVIVIKNRYCLLLALPYFSLFPAIHFRFGYRFGDYRH